MAGACSDSGVRSVQSTGNACAASSDGAAASLADKTIWAAVRNRPSDAQHGIIPPYRAFRLRGVIVGGLVEEIGAVAQDQETVREAGRYPELMLVLRRQLHAHPLSEARASLTHVDGDVEHAA